ISHLEQLNNEIFALLSTRFNCLKIDYLIKRIGINCRNPIISFFSIYISLTLSLKSWCWFFKCYFHTKLIFHKRLCF
ncbi:MAG: hypothetical protein CMK65_09995, partial [Pseudoalteromonas sp.]|nr:hypothetical protein [Pseudoalteromonas sp.]